MGRALFGRVAKLAFPLLAFFAGCGMVTAPVPPSLKLPQPVTNLTAKRTGNSVALAWTMPLRTTDDAPLRGGQRVEVCRRLGTGACVIVARLRLPPGASAGFTDHFSPTLIAHPPRLLVYSVILPSRSGQTGGSSNQAFAASGPAPSPLMRLSARASARGVVLSWIPANFIGTIRIERRLDEKPSKGNAGVPELATLEVDGSDRGRALDESAPLDHTYTYTARRVAHVTVGSHAVEVAGRAGLSVTIDARDTFPPAVPRGLEAVPDVSSGAIDLSWLPDTEPDLAGYIVYRRAAGSKWTRISQPDLSVSVFRDATPHPGSTYQYAVSAIDRDGNESARSAPVSEALPFE